MIKCYLDIFPSHKLFVAYGEAAIAQWIRLRLTPYGPGSNPKHDIYASLFPFENLNSNVKRTKINKKRPI